MEKTNIKRNIEPFNGDKYSFWKTRIRQLLSELKALEVVDSPERAKRLDKVKWEKKERIAKGVIVNYLENSMLSIVTPTMTPHKIFKMLDGLYERKSTISQVSIRKKLLTLKLQGDTPLTKHFMAFEDLIAQLIATGETVSESDKVAHLLLSMSTQYAEVITALETLSPENLTLASVKSRLLDQEVKLMEKNKDTSMKVLQAEIKHENWSEHTRSVLTRRTSH